ncbi:MAG: hypothetical protein JOY61_08735 [Chloroflexi bacterium]|nr:hypothetical protein [Chloroflexota bacterium]
MMTDAQVIVRLASALSRMHTVGEQARTRLADLDEPTDECRGTVKALDNALAEATVTLLDPDVHHAVVHARARTKAGS